MSSAVTLRFAGLLSSFVLLAAGAASAQDADDGELLFETCRGCHAIDSYKNNYPTYNVPRLGGQNAAYISDALKAYGSGARPHPTMHAQAASLSEAQMQAIGAYLDGLADPAGTGNDATPPPQATTCVACHGNNGVGTAPNFPNLAGQHEDYLRHALTAYKTQQRQNAIMAGFAAALSEQDIATLAAWYAGQKGLVTVR